MKLKNLSLPFALAVGMLTLFVLPLIAWQGAEKAHAQEPPDVGAAVLLSTTVEMSPTTSGGLIMDVGETGDTTIQAYSTVGTKIYKGRFELRYNPNVVRRVSIVQGVDAAAVGGSIGTINDDNDGTIFFNIELPQGLTLSTSITDPTQLVDINWQCLEVNNSPLEFIDVDVNTISGTDIPQFQTDGLVTCDYTKMSIGVLPTTDQAVGVGDTVQTTVVVTGLNEVYGIDFGLEFDPNVVEVVDVQGTGLLANSRPTWEVRGNKIIFVGRSSRALNGSGAVARITWQAIDAGTSPQIIDGINTAFLDINDQQIVRLQTSAPQPEMRMPGGNINVSPPDAELYFEDASLSVSAGGAAVQDVRIEGVSDICEVVYRITFDPGVAQVQDDDPNRSGVQIGIGSLFGTNINVTENEADNTNGTIDFRVRSQTPLNALNTSGQISEITWEGLTGVTDLEFVQHSVFDCDNANVQHSIRADSDPGSITVSGTSEPTPTPTTDPNGETPTPTTDPNGETPTPTPTTDPNGETPTPTPTTDPNGETPTPTPTTDPNGETPTPTPTTDSTGTLSGRVALEGRLSDSSGITVHAENITCDRFTASASNQVATTDTDGNFSVTNNGYLCLQVVMDGYIVGQRNNPSGSIGFIELQGGDFVANNAIDIFDLAYAGDKFGTSDALADFNGDGSVDIFDLSIVAGNYGLQGPTENWQR